MQRCIYMRVYTHMYTSIHEYVHLYTYIYVHTHKHEYVHLYTYIYVHTHKCMYIYICAYISIFICWIVHCFTTAYCMWRIISPASSLNQLSCSLRVFCHVLSKRDQLDWDWRIWLNVTPHAIGCNIWLTNSDMWLTNSRLEDLIECHSTCNRL